MWEEALGYAKLYGYENLTSWQNEAYLKYKQELGVTYGYPANDTNSDYSSLAVTSLFGNPGKYVEVPDNIVKQ